MELCRPLPWIDDDKPRLGDFRRQLIGQVKETLQRQNAQRKIMQYRVLTGYLYAEVPVFRLCVNDC